MLQIYIRSITYREPREVKEFHTGAWMRLEDPTDEELIQASETLGVQIDTLRDALDPYETPRLEVEPEGMYIFIRYPDGDSTLPMLVVIAKNGILTVTKEKNPLIQKFADGKIDMYTTQKARFLLLILSEVNRRFTVALSKIRKEVNRKRVHPDKMSSKDIIDFVSYESTLNDFLDSFIPQQAVLNRILASKSADVREDDHDLIEDLILSTNQLIETSRSAIKTMVNIRSAYTAISTEKLNQVLRWLTALTVIFSIPLGITGFYGMNVLLPGKEYEHAASIIAVCIFAVMVLFFFIFIKKKWL
ncbi:hypothetical protein COU15_01235 [Candidatus Kaiserbacteria bacterium CG10_big_fil_rev_8_21_14_0_10_45_20]|uniref:Magnesium transporter CorA family protein n=1 Tax=Candidatus Kaiserbacteria bacterium CG10_big_fil_rev_8_21_14_0_10_45_20 TaxID=1974607 RepID=A0A2H0UG33_9BACT|nr:MAG: hypothetical protein COU15_01235 [Candidatus Kaiserbacteria bacterium CG10_big_fil_rev_8_21_14_0_10_45_20]